MKQKLKGWISAYGMQIVQGSAVDSAKVLTPVTISAVLNSAFDKNATDAMAYTAAKSLMEIFLQMGTKSGS